MYRTAIEYILGIRFSGERLFISPVIPKRWPGFEVTIRHRSATYMISVDNTAQCNGVARLTVDDVDVEPAGIVLRDDGQTHRVNAVMGAARVESMVNGH
jgi:cyclic beta-1,2-glucan synthetase